MDRATKSINDNLKLRNYLNKISNGINYNLLNNYRSFINFLDKNKIGIVVLQDLINDKVLYVSDRFYEAFGFKKNMTESADHVKFRYKFHPDDYIVNISGIAYLEYLLGLPSEKRKDYKLIHEFRVKNDLGKWIRLLVHDMILELDDSGIPWLNLKIFDLSPNQETNYRGNSICRNLLNGEQIHLFNFIAKGINNISDREKEVLSLIAEGMKSKEIADKLFISLNTVNNHRRNLLKKLNVANSSEAVNQAFKYGLIQRLN